MFTRPFLPSLTELLDLELIDTDLYRGINEYPDDGREILYGGQVAAQALMAAGLTVPAERFPHSMHGYFLRPGRRAAPVVFRVERDRDGRSFSARRVTALQSGEVIFDLTASFHVDEPGGEYTTAMPDDLPDPDDCVTLGYADQFPNADARVIPPTVTEQGGRVVSGRLWIRARERLADDRLVQACALAYLSDIGTGFQRPELSWIAQGGASLDHALWFRTPIRADEWLYSSMVPLHAAGARGLYVGSVFERGTGILGATFAQEVLMRPTRPA